MKRCSSEIGVDGVIFDNGPRNRYTSADKLAILRKADMGKNENPSPESGGLTVKLGPKCSATVQNNVILNTAPTGGALAVWGGEESKAVIRNNLIFNNTGEGIFALTQFHPRQPKGYSEFLIEHNTVLFSWKHDAIATYGGNGLKLDGDVALTATHNVFGFGDYGGVDNIKKARNVVLKDNLFTGNRLYDYREFNTEINVSELEDEADLLKDSAGNTSKEIRVPVAERWARLYAGRTEVSRAGVDAAAKASNSGANQLRSMLGLPVQAGAVKMDAEVWLPLVSLDEALPAGLASYEGGFGCSKPQP